MDIIWPLMSFGKSLIKETASVNSPTAGPQEHGDEGWKKTAAPEAAEGGA